MRQNEILMEIKIHSEQRSNEVLHIKICGVQFKQFLNRDLFFNFLRKTDSNILIFESIQFKKSNIEKSLKKIKR